MRNNKILATAITTALAGALSAGGVNAGTMTVSYPSTDPDPNPMYVATEEIGVSQTLSNSCPSGEKIKVSYVLDNQLDVSDVITLTLNEGSSTAGTTVFQTATDDKPGSSPSQISPNTLTITPPSSGSSGFFGLSGGGEGTSELKFIMQGSSVSAGSTLTFNFCVDKADILEEAGQTLGVTLSLTNEDTGGTKTILGSQQGAKMIIDAGTDKNKVKVDIGGEAGAKQLTGSSLGTESAILGQFCLDTNNQTNKPYRKDLKTQWTLSTDTLLGYQLVVTDAPFNASIGHVYAPNDLTAPTDEEKAGVMVFLDIASSGTSRGVFDVNDIPATSVDTTSATFSIQTSTDDIKKDYISDLISKGCVNLIFKVSGNDEIKTHDIPPTGKVTLTFEGGVTREFYGQLNHIKRSGTVCVLYNIPGPNSIENANIRVTNKTATPDGTLIGTLRLPNGTEIFTSYDILTASGLGLIGPNQTIYLNTDKLDTIAQSASNPNGPWTDGWSRAILRLETNLNTVEMMALIRDDDVMGAPLMNMSTGASGNGCDR
jgi:hypothetical protein